jgi:hypothetical protein
MDLPDWRDLARKSAEELDRLDIIVKHLACAAGLPESERIDPDRCIGKLDELVPWAREYTDRAYASGGPFNYPQVLKTLPGRRLRRESWAAGLRAWHRLQPGFQADFNPSERPPRVVGNCKPADHVLPR